MNRRLLVDLAVRLALCAGAGWLAWRSLGAVGLVVTVPLLGIALARPLLDLAGAGLRGARTQAYRDVEGRHYAYRGAPVRVFEDAAHVRWVRAADVRAIVGTDNSDAALALTYGDSFRACGQRGEMHFSAEALLVHLTREPRPQAARFRRWVERDIAFPARQLRQRLGIREVQRTEPLKQAETEQQRGSRQAPAKPGRAAGEQQPP